MQVSRRDFFEALGLLGLGLCLSGEGFVLAEDSEQPTIRNPRKTGELTADEKGSLWRVFSHIGSLWQTGEHCSLSRAEFNQIIDLKTNRPPSYLTEYQAALERLRVLSKAEGERQALNLLFSGGEAAPIRQFVLAELIELNLVYGGFRAFGYRNYKGFMGGSFSVRPAPYRTRKIS